MRRPCPRLPCTVFHRPFDRRLNFGERAGFHLLAKYFPVPVCSSHGSQPAYFLLVVISFDGDLLKKVYALCEIIEVSCIKARNLIEKPVSMTFGSILTILPFLLR